MGRTGPPWPPNVEVTKMTESEGMSIRWLLSSISGLSEAAGIRVPFMLLGTTLQAPLGPPRSPRGAPAAPSSCASEGAPDGSETIDTTDAAASAAAALLLARLSTERRRCRRGARALHACRHVRMTRACAAIAACRPGGSSGSCALAQIALGHREVPASPGKRSNDARTARRAAPLRTQLPERGWTMASSGAAAP